MSEIYNVAVIGKVNSGKSSFIRAYFRHLYGETVDVNPPIDIVECTREPKAYFVSDHPVKLWDMPGYGSNAVKEGDYFIHHSLKNYDSYVMCSAVYSDFELALHNEIAKQRKRYCYVRTKIDMNMRNWQQSKNGTIADWQAEKAKISCQLATYFPDTPIFFIDSKKPTEYDFLNLVTVVLDMAKFSIRSRTSRSSHHQQSKSKQSGRGRR